ncbi:hypothetical protein [Cohnella sp.]|uniref:hypothetical protein n=1 Tax=Cohnella sp. TaxID=1883426 RepID=UPI003569EB29
MRQGIILLGLGVAMWAVATLFFLLFGGWVVLEVGNNYFGSSLFLLEMLTFLLLIGIALVIRLKLFRERGSATRFGFVAAAVGLLLNTFILWYRDSVFSDFTEGQHHGFTVWMTLACALTLLVPAVVDRFVREPAPVPIKVEEATEAPVSSADYPLEEPKQTSVSSLSSEAKAD